MNRRRQYKRTIKRYAAQIGYIERMFEAEMRKPINSRDNDLVQECLETLKYLHPHMDELIARQKAELASLFSNSRHRKLVWTYGVLAFFLLSAGVAQALGFRIWSALLHWDAGYFRVDYVPHYQIELPTISSSPDSFIVPDEEEIIEFNEYSTVDEAIRDLGIQQIMLPSELSESFEISSIRGSSNTISIQLIVQYENDVHKLTYEANLFSDEESAVSIMLPGDEYMLYEKNGLSYMIALNQTKTHVTWTSGSTVYSLSTDLPYEEVFTVIDRLNVYEK